METPNPEDFDADPEDGPHPWDLLPPITPEEERLNKIAWEDLQKQPPVTLEEARAEIPWYLRPPEGYSNED